MTHGPAHTFATHIIAERCPSCELWEASSAAYHVLTMLEERRVISRPPWWDRWSVGFASGLIGAFAAIATLTVVTS